MALILPRPRVRPPPSNYYPPRAKDRAVPRSLAVPLDRAVIRVQVWFNRLPLGISALSIPAEQWLLALILPGYAYALLGRPKLAWASLAGWFAGLLLFVVFLGNPWITGWALGAMASAHSSGQGFLVLREREHNPEAPPLGLWERIWIPLALWFACLALIYWPASSLFQKYLAQPVQLNEQILIINAATDPRTLVRGELVAYRVEQQSYGSVRVAAGPTLGRLSGLPGDRVEFGPEDLRVNGTSEPRRPEMPSVGELRVAPKTRFIWPVLGERIIMNVDRGVVDDAYFQLAQVPESSLIGRPFRSWFFRNQKIP